MAAFTSSQSGNFNDPATWGGAGVPGAADSFTITANIVVTVPSGYSATGTAIFSGGSLQAKAALVVAAGGTFTMVADFNQASWYRLSVFGTLNLNGFSMTQANNARHFELTIKGTAGNRAQVISNGTSTGPDMVYTFLYNEWPLEIAYADFVGLGEIRIPSTANSPFPLYSITNTVFRNCRQVTLGGFSSNDSVWIIDGVDVRDSRAVGTMLTVTRDATGAVGAGNPSRLTRLTLAGSATANAVRWEVENLEKTQIVLKNVIGTNIKPTPMTNSLVATVGKTGPAALDYGGITLLADSYVFTDSDNPHTLIGVPVVDNIVLEATYTTSFSDSGDHFVVPAGNGSFTNSLVLESKSGVLVNAIGVARSGNYSATHNTLVGNYNAAYGALARTESGGTFTGTLSLQSNLVVNISATSTAIGMNFQGPADQVTTMDYNAWFNFGNRYSGVTSATKTPGVTVGYGGNDLVLASLPAFTDSTRNLAKWGQVHLGTTTAQEVVDAFLRLNGFNPATGTQDLPAFEHEPADVVTWTKQGFTVTDAALVASGHDAQNIGILDQAEEPVEPPPASGATTYNLVSPITGSIVGYCVLDLVS